MTSGAASASASKSPTHSPSPTATTASPSASASGSPSASGSASAGQSASATASAGTSSSGAAGYGSSWVTLYWGIQGESTEVAKVQSLLASIGYLDSWRHRSYINPQVNVQPDASGTYGSATDDAVAEFQQDYNVGFSGQQGTCDLTTYNALVQVAG